MKVILVLDKKWSQTILPRLIERVKSVGIDVPLYILQHSPYDFELALTYAKEIKKYVKFPVTYEDLCE